MQRKHFMYFTVLYFLFCTENPLQTTTTVHGSKALFTHDGYAESVI